MKIYEEVVCNYHTDGFWTVDAWKTNDEDEEGVVVALINDITGDCYAIRDLDDQCKGVIDEKQTEICSQWVETIAEMFNGLKASQKDEFLRLTDNQ